MRLGIQADHRLSTYCNTRVCSVVRMNDFDVDVDADAGVGDGYGDDGVRQNHSLRTGYHRRTKLFAARMDRRVPSVPLITDGRCDVANSTCHQSLHPRRNYPFDDAVVQTNLEGRMWENERKRGKELSGLFS